MLRYSAFDIILMPIDNIDQ